MDNKVFPMLQAIGRKLHSNFKNEFIHLAMDVNDVVQENYLYYYDFKERFQNKFKPEIVWSAVKQYVIWKQLEKIYNHRRKKVIMCSFDQNSSIQNEINDLTIKEGGKKPLPFKNDRDLIGILLNHDDNLFIFLEDLLGHEKYEIFMDVLKKEDTKINIAKKRNVSGQYVGQVYKDSLIKIKNSMK